MGHNQIWMETHAIMRAHALRENSIMIFVDFWLAHVAANDKDDGDDDDNND